MAQATVTPQAYDHAPANRPNIVSVGTIVWLSSELMFFAALFSMYFTMRAVNPDLWANETQLLNIPFASLNTTVLVLSSVTCQLGVFAAERGDVFNWCTGGDLGDFTAAEFECGVCGLGFRYPGE